MMEARSVSRSVLSVWLPLVRDGRRALRELEAASTLLRHHCHGWTGRATVSHTQTKVSVCKRNTL